VDQFSYSQKQEELAGRMEVWKEKVIICKERKEEIEIEKYKRNIFLLHKWDILREKVIRFVFHPTFSLANAI